VGFLMALIPPQMAEILLKTNVNYIYF